MRNKVLKVYLMRVTYIGIIFVIILRINLISSTGDKSDIIFFMSFKLTNYGKCVMLPQQ